MVSIFGAKVSHVLEDSHLRWAKAIGVILVATSITGCASVLTVGEPEYACKGIPEGVQCMSVTDVYNATHDGKSLTVSADEGAEGVQVVGASEASGEQIKAEREAAFINTFVAPHLPNQPIPIRTPAVVMRIWIAPWEDKNGDLITTGFVHTEIEPRRWVVGHHTPQPPAMLNPLQVSN